MKKYAYIIPALALMACGGSGESTTTDEPIEKEPQFTLVVNGDYSLDATVSSASWERELDQKATKQKIMLFGSEVDVELGPVKMSTQGNVSITEGSLADKDGIPTKAIVVFDMASMKLGGKNKGDLFDAKTYPNSTLHIQQFEESDTALAATGELTIKDVSKPVEITLQSTAEDDGYLLTGNFTIQTLDWPLREQVKAKDVNKDVISVTFKLHFGDKAVTTDTIWE